LVGGSVPLNLRVLGVWKSVSLGPMRRVLSRTSNAGFLIAVICGFLLFSTRANAYLRSGIFLAKMLLLIVAVASTLVLRLLAAKASSGGQLISGNPSLQARAAAGFSLAAWIAVLTLGRLIGYF
jgi:hypothetical protein